MIIAILYVNAEYASWTIGGANVSTGPKWRDKLEVHTFNDLFRISWIKT